jgi:pimeloyl-ACP methyl ester carboxylesterase
MYLATHPHNNSLVVLIHGVMSNRYMAWERVIDLIQTMHHNGRSGVRSFDFFTFGYSSGRFRQPALDACFAGLRALIAQGRYDTVVLIGHSQGGVAAKLFVIDELQRGRGETLKVDVIITLDSPHRGPQPWIYPFVLAGALLKRIPLVNRLQIFRQVADLGVGSAALTTLRERWNDTLVPREPCAPEPHRRHIRSYTISGRTFRLLGFKLVVSKRSADGFDIDQPLPSEGITGGWTLGHEITAMSAYRHRIEKILMGHDEVGVGTLRRAAPTVPESVFARLLDGEYEPMDLACEAGSWKRRFVSSMSVRPLRKLSPDDAVAKFVALRLRND